MSQDRLQHAGDANGAIWVERHQSGRWKIPFSRIADRAYDNERQAMRVGDAGDGTALQVDGVRVRIRSQTPLCRGIHGDDRAGQKDMTAETAEKLRQFRVSVQPFAVRQHNGRDDYRARTQHWIEATRQPETDQRGCPIGDQPGGRDLGPNGCPATRPNRMAKFGGDPGLGCQTNDKSE